MAYRKGYMAYQKGLHGVWKGYMAYVYMRMCSLFIPVCYLLQNTFWWIFLHKIEYRCIILINIKERKWERLDLNSYIKCTRTRDFPLLVLLMNLLPLHPWLFRFFLKIRGDISVQQMSTCENIFARVDDTCKKRLYLNIKANFQKKSKWR